MGSAAATDNSSQSNSTHFFNSTTDNALNSFNNSTINTTENITYTNDCCSILLHVNDGYDVFAYRRDSTYAAELYLQHLNFYGKDVLKEFKIVNGYFFHTLISGDGWIVATGGPDIPDLNIALENLAGGCFVSGIITGATIDSATDILRQLGMGHFIIKSPNGDVGLTIHNGWTKTALFKMGNGQYVSVPNGPGYYREGYTSTSDAVYSAINLAITDGWGVNRRNILTYEVISDPINCSVLVKIWASSTRSSDNIVYGDVISGGSLPGAPDRIFIGEIVLKNSGTFIGYQSITYMYSAILDYYNVHGELPGIMDMIPWKILSNPNAGPYTNDQVVNAAIWVKNYVDINKRLPEYVVINNTAVNMASFLKFLVTATLNIQNNDLDSVLYFLNCVKGPVPRDSIQSGNISKAEYLKIAGVIRDSMASTLVAPEFYENISLGRFLGYENMIYTFSCILSSYNTSGTLPDSIGVRSWKLVTATSFTLDQVLSAANTVKNYVNTYKKLPDYVPINGININMASFLELVTTAIVNIQKNDLNSVLYLYNCIKGPVTRDELQEGDIPQAEYLKIAGIIKASMDSRHVAPEFYENISLGRFFGYENMIYTFSLVLDSYNYTKALPGSIGVKPWKMITVISFPVEDVVEAACWVKDYVDTYKKLPDYVTIRSININMASFLELITTAIVNIQKNDLDSVLYLYNCVKGPVTRDDLLDGDMLQAEYLKIANVIRNSMVSRLVAPEFYENFSLGRFFGYENMIYTFSDILSSYNTTRALPGSIGVKPWKMITVISFPVEDVVEAACWVKDYVDTNKKLPDYVTINNKDVNMASFLELLSTATLNINNNDFNSLLYFHNCIRGSIPRDEIQNGNLLTAEYLKIAGVVKSSMDTRGVAPEFYENISLGRFLGYENMIYMYTCILNAYNSTNTLPDSIGVRSWKLVTATTFSLNEVLNAAYYVKNYVDINKRLPEYVTINNKDVNMASFLKFLVTATLNIQNNDLDSVLYFLNCVKGPVPRDSIQSGNISKAEYLKISNVIKSSMDKRGAAPEFYENISLGRFFGYENMVYTFSCILSSYNTSGTLPDSIGVRSWKLVTATTFSLNEVLMAANWVKDYADTYKKLPDYVTINSINVNIASFLELLTTATLNIQKNDLISILYLYNCIKGPVPQDSIQSGNISKAEYLKIANVIKSSMDKRGAAPEFYENISLGRFFGYENMVYTFSCILSSYNTAGTLPDSIGVRSWKLVTITSFTLDQVLSAANTVKNYIESNKNLPDYVPINGTNINMASFLELITTAMTNIQKNDLNSVLYLYNCVKGQISRDELQEGDIPQAEYLKIAGIIKASMDSRHVAPEFYENFSLGRFFGYENMIYTFSLVLDSYNTTRSLPGAVKVKPWRTIYNSTIVLTNDQVISAAYWVKRYIEANHQLPDVVETVGKTMNVHTYLYAASSAIQNIYNKNIKDVYATSYNAPQITKENIQSGNMKITDYIKVADQIKVYIERTGAVPGYITL